MFAALWCALAALGFSQRFVLGYVILPLRGLWALGE